MRLSAAANPVSTKGDLDPIHAETALLYSVIVSTSCVGWLQGQELNLRPTDDDTASAVGLARKDSALVASERIVRRWPTESRT